MSATLGLPLDGKEQRPKRPFFMRICSRAESLSIQCFHLSNPNPAKQRNESFLPVTGSEPTKVTRVWFSIPWVLLILIKFLLSAVNKGIYMGCWYYSIKLFNNIYRDVFLPGAGFLLRAQPFPRRGRTDKAADWGYNCWNRVVHRTSDSDSLQASSSESSTIV